MYQEPSLQYPREPWANRYAVGVMRMEEGLPRDHREDPQQRAFLTETALARLNQLTASGTPRDQVPSYPGDDELGLDDAASIDENVVPNPTRLVPSFYWIPAENRRYSPPPEDIPQAEHLADEDQDDVDSSEILGGGEARAGSAASVGPVNQERYSSSLCDEDAEGSIDFTLLQNEPSTLELAVGESLFIPTPSSPALPDLEHVQDNI